VWAWTLRNLMQVTEATGTPWCFRTTSPNGLRYFQLHGVPARIVHDRATEFSSDVLQDTAAILGVEQLPTSGGHPQTDGLVEQLNRTL